MKKEAKKYNQMNVIYKKNLQYNKVTLNDAMDLTHNTLYCGKVFAFAWFSKRHRTKMCA